MKRITLTLCVAAFFLFACNNEKKTEEKTAAESSTTADSKKEPAWIPIDSAKMMESWMQYAAVNEPHKMLAKSSGKWKAETTMWMADGAPPVTGISTSTNRMIMDGRYQISDYKGDFMGQPFNGMSIMGYDNYKKVYVNTWIDNMGSGIMIMEGPWDEATKSITLTGKYTNPANGLECEFKEVVKIIDDNTQMMEMYGPDPTTGKQYKTMEIKFTRSK